MNPYLAQFLPKIKALRIYQIAGGCIGIALTGWSFLTNMNKLSAPILLILVIAVMLYAFSIYCAILLLDDTETALNLLLINQGLQILNFGIAGFAFKFVSGFYLSAGLDMSESTSFMFNAGLSEWTITLNANEPLAYVNINFVALSLFFFILNLKDNIKKARIENQLSDFIVSETEKIN